MKNLTINQQRSKDKFWTDENGTQIPYNRTTKSERLIERHSASLAKKALKINSDLAKFKDEVTSYCQEIAEQVLKELDSKKEHKGNFTFFNFDRTIKIDVDAKERIEFDDLTIQAAKEKLDSFLEDSVQGETVVKQLILDAFTKSRGKLDVKKVLSLLKYRDRVNDNRFKDAINLIEKSIRRLQSRTYFRVWIKNDSGEFESVDLNFSSI